MTCCFFPLIISRPGRCSVSSTVPPWATFLPFSKSHFLYVVLNTLRQADPPLFNLQALSQQCKQQRHLHLQLPQRPLGETFPAFQFLLRHLPVFLSRLLPSSLSRRMKSTRCCFSLRRLGPLWFASREGTPTSSVEAGRRCSTWLPAVSVCTACLASQPPAASVLVSGGEAVAGAGCWICLSRPQPQRFTRPAMRHLIYCFVVCGSNCMVWGRVLDGTGLRVGVHGI